MKELLPFIPSRNPSAALPSSPSPPQLSAVLLFRLFAEDALHFTSKDLFQWMDYMRYAGVDHFYLYDNCLVADDDDADDECVEHLVGALPDVTYVKWQVQDYIEAQVPAYNHHLRTHFPQASYEILLDMDEYPFMPNSDMNPNFLKDYALKKQSSQVLLRTVFFGGVASSDDDNDWRVLRYTRRRAMAERDGRTKPMYQPSKINYDGTQNLHEMLLLDNGRERTGIKEEAFKYSPYDLIMGYDKMEDESVLRLNHYWCERLSDSTDETTPPLVYDDSMTDVIRRVKEWKTTKG
eukprot:CAMPEP_0119009144 /NCGR_PEP_ID=MMETSP1176-20130426/4168_1 /TAXON_ID=265551 /ORGANISM="Synedropsis recta cf, Strain CCMP1620" /LENGTH=292 /DNA_ID=CAMNT_0006961601 /DNA_START=64 /DNA_END=942 /DNA_ORIENTATION=+